MVTSHFLHDQQNTPATAHPADGNLHEARHGDQGNQDIIVEIEWSLGDGGLPERDDQQGDEPTRDGKLQAIGLGGAECGCQAVLPAPGWRRGDHVQPRMSGG
jgi:hypothetical protein